MYDSTSSTSLSFAGTAPPRPLVAKQADESLAGRNYFVQMGVAVLSRGSRSSNAVCVVKIRTAWSTQIRARRRRVFAAKQTVSD